MTGSVHVRAPCRLHFGLFSFGQASGAQFGGVGAMVEPPAVEVVVEPAEQFNATGLLAARAEHFVRSLVQNWRLGALPACHIHVSCPPDHTGLGVGTQLGLSIATGVQRLLHRPELTVEDLAMSVGRGSRSAIGAHGFLHGGLIVDAGKHPGEPLGQLAHRVALPDAWRFVLVRAAEDRGLAGASEAEAFNRLPPVPAELTERLWRITVDEMLPAIARGDCAAFGETVYQFGRLAGNCFSAVQQGSFASPQIAQLVETIRAHGVPGVGQSSWGPTVFAIVPSDAEAQSVAAWLHDSCGLALIEIVVARPNNTGAQISAL